jgi:hypothetical protein
LDNRPCTVIGVMPGATTFDRGFNEVLSTAGLILFTSIIFSVAPAWQASRVAGGTGDGGTFSL